MTNHNALARQFTVSDNFYMEPEASGVGHRWLVGVQPNNFCQMTYTLGWNFKAHSSAPGRRASFGSNGSIAPEDYPEAGSMWEHLARHGIPFRNYGEGFELAGVAGGEPDHVDAQRSVLLVISPWTRHGYVSHRHTTIVSMHRTLYEILGLPPLNMFDALANDFSDCFVATPDNHPYQHVAVDPRIFDPEKARDPNDPEYKKASRSRSIARDDAGVEEEVLRAGGS